MRLACPPAPPSSSLVRLRVSYCVVYALGHVGFLLVSLPMEAFVPHAEAYGPLPLSFGVAVGEWLLSYCSWALRRG